MDAQWDEQDRASRKSGVFGKTVRWLFLIGLAVMLGWFMLRAHYQNGTPLMKRYLFTGEAAERYQAGELEVRELLAYNEAVTGRSFYIGNLRYTEALSQFQFMIRFNRYSEGISSWISEHGKHSFTFVLADDRGNRYSSYQYLTDSMMMYGYYRLIFSGVDTREATELKVYVFRDDGQEHELSEALENCIVWYSDGVSGPYRFSASEKRAEKPTAGLLDGRTALHNETAAE